MQVSAQIHQKIDKIRLMPNQPTTNDSKDTGDTWGKNQTKEPKTEHPTENATLPNIF